MLRRTLLGWLAAAPLIPLAARAVRPSIAPLLWTEADIAEVARRWDAMPQRTPEQKAALCQRLYGFGGWYADCDVVPPRLES